jgi:hypothetical protein
MELLTRIQALLLRKDVTATLDGNDELMFFAMCEPLSVRMQIRVRDKLITVRAHFPMFVPPHRRQAVMEAISLINFRLRMARCELDASDGELICRSDFPLHGDAVPTDEQLTRLIYSVWNVSEKYCPGLVEIMTTTVDPVMVIAQLEAAAEHPTPSALPLDVNVN